MKIIQSLLLVLLQCAFYAAGASTSSVRGSQRALTLDQRQVAIEPPLEVTFFKTPKSLSDEATGVFVDAINEFSTARMKDFFQNKFPEHILDTVEFQVLQKQSIQHKDDANIYGTTFILSGAFTFETTNIPSLARCNNKLMTIMQNYWKLENAIRNRNHSELSPYPVGEAFFTKASEWEVSPEENESEPSDTSETSETSDTIPKITVKDESEEPKKKKNKAGVIVGSLFGVAIAAFVGLVGYRYYTYDQWYEGDSDSEDDQPYSGSFPHLEGKKEVSSANEESEEEALETTFDMEDYTVKVDVKPL
ncbi:predicted protein [Chaetoceros tenuissimus]|uniref:SEA domain-containing protein n=1 Tax=Chaetoceros tenuissimus TaxID=426638 RepID=A0AAD3CSX3_9STRA|nr:predicted protein [Chaetoceros tenuissimus]